MSHPYDSFEVNNVSIIQELEAEGYIRQGTLVEELSVGLGLKHGHGIVRQHLQTPLNKYRQHFVHNKLIVEVSETSLMGMYHRQLLYFFAAYYAWNPPFSSPRSAFEADRFQTAFFNGEEWALKRLPRRMRKQYDKLIGKSRQPGAIGAVVVPLRRVG